MCATDTLGTDAFPQTKAMELEMDLELVAAECQRMGMVRGHGPPLPLTCYFDVSCAAYNRRVLLFKDVHGGSQKLLCALFTSLCIRYILAMMQVIT
jgi:hypothetical protein